jgi:hypothetical protein
MANGVAGAPEGNTNASKGKRWHDSLIRAIEAYPNPIDNKNCSAMVIGLNTAASAFVLKMIEESNIAFFREFGDRLDGKAAMSVALSGSVDSNIKSISADLSPQQAAQLYSEMIHQK